MCRQSHLNELQYIIIILVIGCKQNYIKKCIEMLVQKESNASIFSILFVTCLFWLFGPLVGTPGCFLLFTSYGIPLCALALIFTGSPLLQRITNCESPKCVEDLWEYAAIPPTFIYISYYESKFFCKVFTSRQVHIRWGVVESSCNAHITLVTLIGHQATELM